MNLPTYSAATLQTMDVIRNEAVDLLISDLGAFQNQLNELSRLYTKHERSLVKQLSTSGDESFLDYYTVTVLPVLYEINSVPSDTKFMNTFRDKLHMRFTEAVNQITPLVEHQVISVRRRYTEKYCMEVGMSSKSVGKLMKLIERSQPDLSSIYNHHLNYHLFSELGQQAGVPFVDSQSGWWSRLKSARQVRSYHKTATNNDVSLPEYNNQRKQLLEAVYGAIIDDVVKQQWSLAEVFSLRNKYEKLATQKNKLNDVDRLKIIETVTESFIHKQVKRHQTDSTQMNSVATLHGYKSDLAQLMINIFMLTPTQKNYLLKAAK